MGPWVEDFIEPIIFSDATKAIAAHRKAGDRILVISASGTHLVRPIADRLGIDEILGIELEVAHGVYSGHTVGTLTYREGKITRLLEWLDAEEENLEGASFYSDSRNDLPLLLKVDFPHVVNPDPMLLEHAEKPAGRSISGNNAKPCRSKVNLAPKGRGLSGEALVDQQHHLPRHGITRQLGKRRFGILDRKSLRQLRTQPSFGKQRPDVLTQVAEQVGLELVISGAQRRTQQLHALGQHLGQVQLGLPTAHQADQDPAAITGQQFEIQRCVIAPNRIEDDIERPQVAQAVQVIATDHPTLGSQSLAVGQTLFRPDADPARVAKYLAQLNGS